MTRPEATCTTIAPDPQGTMQETNMKEISPSQKVELRNDWFWPIEFAICAMNALVFC